MVKHINLKLLILMASLALNGFFLGRIIVKKPSCVHSSSKPFITETRYHKKHWMFKHMRPDAQKARPLMTEAFKARKQALKLLFTQPLDEEKVRNAMEKARQKQYEIWKYGDESLLKNFKKLSEEEREKLHKEWMENRKFHKHFKKAQR